MERSNSIGPGQGPVDRRITWGMLSSLDELSIVRAQEKDLDTVLGLLDEAAEWLASRGIPGWWRPGSFPREAFLDQIRLGEVYIARLGREAVGTITLQ